MDSTAEGFLTSHHFLPKLVGENYHEVLKEKDKEEEEGLELNQEDNVEEIEVVKRNKKRSNEKDFGKN